MNLTKRLLASGWLAALLAACGQEPATADTASKTTADIPSDSRIQLRRIGGLQGLIDSGDELVILVYPLDSREGRIRNENMEIAELSMSTLSGGKALAQEHGPLVNVPDILDKTGSRFFLFERNGNQKLYFRGVCAGPWEADHRESGFEPVCDFTYPFGQHVVSIELPEGTFRKNGPMIARRVLESLAQDERP